MLTTSEMMSYTSNRRRNMSAVAALKWARQNPSSAGWTQFYPSHGNVTRQPDRPNYAWIENVSAIFRMVDYADNLVQLRHTGWFTDDDGDNGEAYRGVVYKLNHNRGFIAGYADPINDGAAFVCLDIVPGDATDAARFADRIAEIEAEHARDYNRAWRAGRDYEELKEELARERTAALELFPELRDFADIAGAHAPVVRAITAQLRKHIDAWCAAKAKRAELLADFGKAPGWEG